MYGVLLVFHVLAATIWTGGHIVLSTVVLPRALQQRSPDVLLAFESGYEKVGMPALVVQVITGLLLAYGMLPEFSAWFDMGNQLSRLIVFKLVLLGATLLLAMHARLRVIPSLSERTLNSLAWHIIPVTLISILFVIVGISFRTGWFS